MTVLSEEEIVELKSEQDTLRSMLQGDMFCDMEIMDKIHNIQMKLDGTKPGDSYVDCIGCGS